MLEIPLRGKTPKVYEGHRLGKTVDVTVNGRFLEPRSDLNGANSTEFDWGYGGNAPAQLALAILADYLADDVQALNLYKVFNLEVIAKLACDNWEMTSLQIEIVLQCIRTRT
jgi:hypothetical protein